jgi:acyl-[acyl-carrier-protein]-phospholipid O-acyltransferase / long-chain-fatty-acid--[acyl-carrier-protein] ligase
MEDQRRSLNCDAGLRGLTGEDRLAFFMGTLPGQAEGRLPANDPRSGLLGFWALIATQFQGAFTDNALKWLVSFLVLESSISREQRDFLFVLVVPLVFAIPFLVFSIPGGYFADRFSKRSVTVCTKALEILTMGFATYALWIHRLDLAAVALFFVCTQEAIFGPSKYGLMPELLPTSKLSWGNGVIEFWTLLAAIAGTLAGAFLAHHFHGRQQWSGIFLMVLSLFGLLTSTGISRVPAADPSRHYQWNWAKELFEEIRRMRKDAVLWAAVIANAFFWFLGAILLLNIVLYATDILQVDEAHSSYLLATLSLGIGAGSYLAGYASGRKIEMGMILPGMTGIVLATGALFIPGLTYELVMILLFTLGVFAGFFLVPINALIQKRPRPEVKGRVIGTSNLLSFGGIALQPLAQYAMLRLGHPDPGHVFLICSMACVGMCFVLARMLPELWPSALYWTRLRQRASL